MTEKRRDDEAAQEKGQPREINEMPRNPHGHSGSGYEETLEVASRNEEPAPKDAEGRVVQAGDPEPVDGMPRNPAGTPGRGAQTAERIGQPRDRETVEGHVDVVPGFTQTSGASGTTGGRALHGVAPEDADEVDAPPSREASKEPAAEKGD